MNERRLDVRTGEWTTVSTARQERTFLPSEVECPLCPTTDPARPTEIPLPDYQIAVFDNRFASLLPRPPDPSTAPSGAAPIAPAVGAAEVVVYSPDHRKPLGAMSVARIERVIEVWADRYADLGARDEVGYVFIFENRGVEVGVTLHHPHGQIYAYPDVPPRPALELRAALDHLARTERCITCDVVGMERANGSRVLVENDSFTAFVPFAARFPYEVHIVSRRHATSLLDLTTPERFALAEVMKRVLAGYDALFGFPMPYVMAMHQAPADDGAYLSVSHLHLEYSPPYRTADKLKYLAGSEIGAGAFMNDTRPESTAAQLRAAIGAAGS